MQIRSITPVLHKPEPDEVPTPKRRRRKKPKEEIVIVLGYTIELFATPDEVADINQFDLFHKDLEITPSNGAGEGTNGERGRGWTK